MRPSVNEEGFFFELALGPKRAQHNTLAGIAIARKDMLLIVIVHPTERSSCNELFLVKLQ